MVIANYFLQNIKNHLCEVTILIRAMSIKKMPECIPYLY